MKKKLLSIVLAIATVFSTVPVYASIEEVPEMGVEESAVSSSSIEGGYISVDRNAVYLEVGETVKIDARVYPADCCDITYESSDESIATVNSEGVVTAVKTGHTSIKIISDVGTVGVIILVGTRESKAQDIELSKTSVRLVEGDTYKIEAKVLPEGATGNVHWYSYDDEVASITKDGVITANKMGVTRVKAICGNLSKYAVIVVAKDNNKLPFNDVNRNSWYYDAVRWVYEEELMVGLSDSNFGTNQSISRADFVTILWRGMGKQDVAIQNSYSDVDSNAYYAKAVAWATKCDIIEGYGNGTFGVNDSITREQLVSILYRCLKSYEPDKSQLLKYPDYDKVSEYAVDAMSWAVEEEIVNGEGDGNLNPKGEVNRATCAMLVYNFTSVY